jgi:hypothetical protein
MKLLGLCDDAWKAMVESVFDTACKNYGETRLPYEMNLRFKRHGELTEIMLPAGTSLFFPLLGGPQGDRKKAKRSKDTCVVLGESVHMTLSITPLGVEISSYSRMRTPSHV